MSDDRFQVVLPEQAALTVAEMLAERDELRAERDRLRAVVERAHDHVGLDEHVLRSLAVDDLVALVAVLRRDYADVVAERDRLRRAMEDMRHEKPTDG